MDADAILASLFDKEARENPYPRYAALRALGPISPLTKTPPGVAPVVAVATGYDVIDQVLRDSKFYKKRGEQWWDHPVLSTFEASMMFSNPPQHMRMRRVFQHTFTPRRLKDLEPIIEQVAGALLDRMAELASAGEKLDFVTEFAQPMPEQVMAAFLGIPASELDWYRARVKHIDNYLDLDGKTPERLQAADNATSELREFYSDMIASRRERPCGDLVSALVEAIDAGVSDLTESELISNLVVLFNASFVTTVHLLSTGLPLLLTRPDLTAALPTDLDLALDCADEVLRYDNPVQFLIRTAPHDLELGGTPVPKDRSVLLMIAGGNRDPERYEDPDEFRPERPKLASLSFGAGPHFCMGAGVARLEAQIAFAKLFERFPKLRLTEEPVSNRNLFLRGNQAVPIALS